MTGALLLAGCGKMGGALLEGWIKAGYPPKQITVVEPDKAAAQRHGRKGGPAFLTSPDDLKAGFAPALVAFAVKPQMMDSVAPSYGVFAGPDTVFLSIAAGKTIANFEYALGPRAAVVRAMPNTPAAVGHGISVACANALVSDEQRRLCGDLLAAVGEVAWVADEALLDPVTAVSGSGPAYVFLLVECLAGAGIEAGLPEDLAQQLARHTITGAGELLRLSEDDAATLRKNVTSPAGTTQAALDVLMADDGLERLMIRAVDAATRRSRELAG